MASVELPVIDLAHLQGDGRAAIVEQIQRACEEWGFFQIVNHGAAPHVMKAALEVAVQFFALPMDEKVEINKDADQLIGYGTRYCSTVQLDPVGSGRECLRHLSNLTEPCTDLLPDKPASYREDISGYCLEIRSLAWRFMPAVFESLSVVPTAAVDAPTLSQITVVNHYPPCAQPQHEGAAIGFAAHSDGTALTILLQQDDVCGLQIRKRNGDQWVDAKPIQGALAVIIGDEIEACTNGRYKGVEHRALRNASRSRISIATSWCDEGGLDNPRPPIPPP